MKITMNSIYSRINADLNRLTEGLDKTNSAISSGKIYRLPSDEPVAMTHAQAIRNAISDTDQYQRNITYGKAWTTATETTLTQVQDRLMRAKSLAVQGINDSQSAESRKAIAAEIKTIMEEVATLGNTKLGGRYILAGSRTTDYPAGVMPLMLNKDGTVEYHGNQDDLKITVADGVTQKINIDGHSAFMATGVFDGLKSLQDGLNANSRGDLEIALGDIDTAIEKVNSLISQIGAYDNTLTNKTDMASTLSLTNKERLSDIEETDMVKAVTELQTKQISYQAALGAASKVMGLSLADYLK